MYDEIDRLLQKGFIEVSASPFCAPCFFVDKKDGTLRMVVDYRQLNKGTKRQHTPLPRIDDTLDMLGGAKYFSSLDLHSGYHQIRINPTDVEKTGFRTPFGQYNFKVLAFGLTNAPATFQSVMNRIFSRFIGKFVLVYLDDILIYSKTKEEHLEHLQIVMQVLREHKLYAKLKKCSFMQQWTLFLGHLIGADGIRVDDQKVRSVLEWLQPSDVTQVRSFLGLTNYFRRFIQAYAALAAPLHKLTRPKSPFVWTPDCEFAFQGLKEALTTAPVLKAPDFSKPFTMISDASGFGMGGVLLQDHGVIAFNSKRFSDAEKNYSVTEQELRVVVYNFEVWRPYLEGAVGVTVITDHNPNTFFQDKQVLSRRQVRWYEFLSRFHFDWKYEPGRTNVADPLSRCPNHLLASVVCTHHWGAVSTRGAERGDPCDGSATQRGGLVSPRGPSIRNDSIASQRGGSTLPRETAHPNVEKAPEGVDGTGNTRKRRKILPVPPTSTLPYAGQTLLGEEHLLISKLKAAYATDPAFSNPDVMATMEFKNGLWYKTHKGRLVVAVPNDLEVRRELIAAYHCPPYRGHGSWSKTQDLIERYFHWAGLHTQVRKFCEECDFCQRNKASNLAQAGQLQPIPPPIQPWDTISLDWIVGLPEDGPTGNNSILVVVDKLSKMGKFIPCKSTMTSPQLAEILENQIFCIWGKPLQIISDRDPKVTGKFFSEWCIQKNIKQCLSTAYHPQSDGQTERMNRILQDYLRNYVNPQGNNWAKFLPCAEFAINNRFQDTIRTTPFFLNLGREPRAPDGLESALPSRSNPSSKRVTSHVEAASRYRADSQAFTQAARACLQAAEHRELSWLQARVNTEHAQGAQKRQHDKRRRMVSFKEGDYVLLSTRNAGRSTVQCTKFLPKFIGPYKVLQRIGDVAYRLELPSGGRWHNVFHVSLLKAYKGPITPPARQPPLPRLIDGDLWYEVDRILDHKVTGSRRKGAKVTPIYHFLVQWKGCHESDNSWEPTSNFASNPETRAMLKFYRDSHNI
jgi:hypothetical protein